MAQVEVFLGLLVAVVVAAMAVRRLERFPDAVALTVCGIAAGLLPFAPQVQLEPDLILVVFLPPILYPSAFGFALEDLRPNLGPVAMLAVGLVLITMAGIGAALHIAAGVPWAAALAIGAVLAPTDPIAATTLIRSSGAPGRLSTILEGESLVNDGTALTALTITVAAVGGTFSIVSSAGRFFVIAVGGAAIGAALGWLTSRLRRQLDDLELETAIAVLLAYGSYVLADRLGVSGVLAVVFAGYVMGRTDDVLTARTRLGGQSFWSVTRFLGESILFLLVGIAFARVLGDPATRGPLALAALTALVVAVTLGVRLAWMFSVPHLTALLDPTRSSGSTATAGRERLVVGLAGLRGAVSIAAALSVPFAVSGVDFPERSTLVAVAIASIVALLVLPALALPLALRRLDLSEEEEAEHMESEVRAELAEAALARADQVSERQDIPHDVLARVREPHELRLRRFGANEADDAAAAADRTEDYRALSREAVAAQRERLADLRREGKAHGDILREIERDLDLEELHDP